MPTKRLDSTNPKTIGQFDVIGIDGVITGFVTHVGLSSDVRNDILAGSLVPLLHMQPPLEYSTEGSSANVWGTAELSVDEVRKIHLFADELIGEYETQGVTDRGQYCVIPKSEVDQSFDGTPVRRQFSCASFVVEAYRHARIRFLDATKNQLPQVTLDTLKIAYGDGTRVLESQRFRERNLNLQGDGPWPVLLPGYVFNALDREVSEIRQNPPYRALSGDEYFPSRRLAPEKNPRLGQ